MIHPDTALKFISEEFGYGVFATKLIPAGTIIWVQDKLDREFTPEEFENLDALIRPHVENHTFRNRNGNYVFCWDIGKYINHSFNPNCLATAYDFEIAIRDIQSGEQITDDYGYLNIIAPFEPADEGTERKIVFPDDLLRYHKEWDKKIEDVFSRIIQMEQPLRPLIGEGLWKKIGLIAEGKAELDSILNNYFDEKNIQSYKN